MNLSTIDPKKCPTLYRIVERMREHRQEGWGRVTELRRAGELDAAERLARKLLGVQGPPMSEETKEKLRQYNEEHRKEIKERRQQQRDVRKRTIEILSTPKRRRKLG